MTDKRIWITDRLPTEADADKDGDIEYCSFRWPNEKYCHYMNWKTLMQFEPILPWRHTSMWTPPTPTPEPSPAAPEFRVGQVWRTRDGQICKVKNINNNFDFPIETDLYLFHSHDLHGKSILGEGTDFEDDLIELISENPPTPAAPEPEPEPEEDAPPEPVYIYAERATRGFAWFSRVNADQGHAVEEYAVATDGTAWWRFVGKDDCLEDKEWVQIRPLPQPGEE